MQKTIFGVLAALTMICLTSFAASAQSGYKIRSGDVLTIEVLEDSSQNRKVLVKPDGNIDFPQTTGVSAAGRTTSSVSGALTEALAPNYATPPNVFVSIATLGERRTSTRKRRKSAPAKIEVFGMGELQAPGKAEISKDTTLLQFLAQAGGFTKFAATKRIQLRRGSTQQVFVFNYRAFEQGKKAPNAFVTLKDGDVVVVPEKRLFE